MVGGDLSIKLLKIEITRDMTNMKLKVWLGEQCFLSKGTGKRAVPPRLSES